MAESLEMELDAPGNWDALWAVAGEGLIGGIHHALNNRVAALSAISQVLGIGLPDAEPLVASLSGEVDRLEDAVALVALLRRGRSRRAEPVQLFELTTSLVPLLQLHADLKETRFEVSSDAGLIPVWAERDLLTRVLLTLMLAVGAASERRGKGVVRVVFEGDDERAGVRVEGGAEARDGQVAPRIPRGLHAGAAVEAARELGGDFEAGAGTEPASYSLFLPTLLTAENAPPI